MNYKEMMALSVEEFTKIGPDEALSIIREVPWGYQELDDDNCLRLADIHTIGAASIAICAATKQDQSVYKNLCSQIYTMIRDDTPEQSFMMGQVLLASMLSKYFGGNEGNEN